MQYRYPSEIIAGQLIMHAMDYVLITLNSCYTVIVTVINKCSVQESYKEFEKLMLLKVLMFLRVHDKLTSVVDHEIFFMEHSS